MGGAELHKSFAGMLNDSSIDQLMAIDNEWNIIAWNKTSELLHQAKRSDVMGKNLLQSFPQIAEDAEMMEGIKSAFNGFKSFVPSDKKQFNREHFENHFIPLKNDDEKVVGVMNITHDVAHRIHAEHELQRLNGELEKKYQQLKLASEELSTLTFITSKNLKEPIRQIYTTVEFMIKSEGRSLSDSGKANLRRMQSSLNRMNLLLDDMLGLSQINTFQKIKSFTDFNEVLNETIDSFKNRITETGATIKAEKLPAFSAYPDLIHFLFFQLLDNSLKFKSEGKTPDIEVSSERKIVEAGETPGVDANDYWIISFKDNGVGFDQLESEKIFMMFEKLNPSNKLRGSGIGLAISRKIMNAHDGFIRAEGVPGDGTVFCCYFPREKQEV